MTGAWKQWEGQVVNGEFHLRQFLGGGENCAVFLTEHGERETQRAAIKLIALPPEYAELQLSQWRRSAKLSHPHLIRLFQMGQCQLDDVGLLFVVMEYAEENLSQILPQRPLTPAEAREMLEPVLDTLAYLHGQGFVHGHVKPANIMAVEDQLKISSDGLCPMDESRVGLGQPGVYDAPEMAGGEPSPAADVWSLGMTMVEGLTQRVPVWERSEQAEPVLPETLPAPFLELVRHCLRRDPQRRWTVADIVAHMQHPPPAPQSGTVASPQRAVAKWPYVVLVVGLGLVLAAILAGPRIFNRHRDAQRAPTTEVKQPAGELEPARKSTLSTDDKNGHAPAPSEAGQPAPAVGPVPGKVIHQVLPDVPRNARNTIQGKVRVGVRVRVDPSGGVAGAKLDSPGPSKYFAGLALKAARHWKFDPAKIDGRNVSSEWILRFEFGKAGTKAVPVQAAPR
ncbi:MAG TPA: TonB family protein [Bryobacteraceae bacterium]|nr:TonB family protein [Bryobacteraceae bacterium]